MKIVVNNEIVDLTPEGLEEFKKELGMVGEEPSRKEKIVNAIRKTYSIDDELAILRQRDSKPEEFKAYFDFVENIKQSLKEKEVN